MQISFTRYPDLDQLVQDLLYLDAIEENIQDELKMNITIFIPPRLPQELQTYIWQTIN